MANHSETFTLGKAVLPVYLPAFLFAIGEGSIIPIIPATATAHGSDLAMAGIIAALLTIGSLIGNVPAGILVARFGERNSMIWSAVVFALGGMLAGFAPNLLFFGLAIFVLGLAHSTFALARHAFMTTFVPLSHRSRALSTLGGAFRGGIFVGPFVTAGIIFWLQDSIFVYFGLVILAAIIVLVLVLIEDPTEALILARLNSTASIPIIPDRPEPLWRTVHKFRLPLIRLGIPAAILAGLRTSRQVLLPLWAVSIGINETDTSIIMGVAGAVDFGLFYLGGVLMDRYGRLWTAAPSLAALSIGFFTLAFTHGLDSNVQWFIAMAIFLSLANGVSSGVLMTLGSDLAPKYSPAPFLATWRLSSDTGQALTPLVISGMTGIASIGAAALTISSVGVVGVVLFCIFLPRYDPLQRRLREEKRARNRPPNMSDSSNV